MNCIWRLCSFVHPDALALPWNLLHSFNPYVHVIHHRHCHLPFVHAADFSAPQARSSEGLSLSSVMREATAGVAAALQAAEDAVDIVHRQAARVLQVHKQAARVLQGQPGQRQAGVATRELYSSEGGWGIGREVSSRGSSAVGK